MVTHEIGPHEELLEIAKTRKLKWFGHTMRADGLAKTCLQGTVRGGRNRGRPRKKSGDDVTEWMGNAARATENREHWRGLVREAASYVGPQPRKKLWEQ